MGLKADHIDRNIANLLNNMSIIASYVGDLDRARTLQEESLSIRRALGNKWAIANSLNNLGMFATDQGGLDWEEVARRHDLSHGAVRKAVSDLRRRFGVLLRREVRNIVTKDEEVNDELRYLVNLLSREA